MCAVAAAGDASSLSQPKHSPNTARSAVLLPCLASVWATQMTHSFWLCVAADDGCAAAAAAAAAAAGFC
jgi:hypothetical protein